MRFPRPTRRRIAAYTVLVALCGMLIGTEAIIIFGLSQQSNDGIREEATGSTESQSSNNQRGTEEAPLVGKAMGAAERNDIAAKDSKWADWGPETTALWLQLIAFVAQGVLLYRTIATMRATERRQLRPYLFGKMNITPHGDGGQLAHQVLLVDYENTGMTLATDVRVWLGHAEFPIMENREPEPDISNPGPPTTVAPRGSTNSGLYPIPIEPLMRVWNRESELFIWYRVEYRSTFDPKTVYHQAVCAMVDFIRRPDALVPQGHPQTVTLRIYGPHNSAN